MANQIENRKRLIQEMERLCRLTKVSSEVYCDRYGNEVKTVTKRIHPTVINDIDGWPMTCSAVRLHNGDIEFHEYQSTGEFSNFDFTEFETKGIRKILDILTSMK